MQVLVEWKTRLRQWGYIPIFCSVESKRGLDSLAFYLRDRTTVIVGPSGVGKSSLINALRSTDQTPTLMEDGSLFDHVGFKSLLFSMILSSLNFTNYNVIPKGS